MKLIILPLLVVSQLNLQNEVWKYGPEVIYNITYNADFIPHPNASKQHMGMSGMVLASRLKCRPRTPTVLSCHLDEPITRMRPFNSTELSPPVSSIGKGLDLDIRFNELGIKELVVSSSIWPRSLDIERAIVNQLHVGLDLTNKAEGTFQSWENFTTGNCLTTYEIKLEDSKGNAQNKTQGMHKIWSHDVRAIINKTRDLKKCRHFSPYYFSSASTLLKKTRIPFTMKSSKSRIILDPSTFVSSTETEVDLNNVTDSGIAKMRENMTITFDSVMPAKGELQQIEDPASAGIITGKWIHDEFSAESDEI